MNIQESVRLVEDSKPIFGTTFYEKLFQQHGNFRDYFRDIPIQRQAAILTMQLSVIEAFHVRQSPAAGMYLQLLGTKHKDRGIPKDAYPRFRDVLLDALQQFHGEDWSDDLEQQWREAIDSSVNKMFEGYENRFHI